MNYNSINTYHLIDSINNIKTSNTLRLFIPLDNYYNQTIKLKVNARKEYESAIERFYV